MDRALPIGNKLCAARVAKRYEGQRMQRLREMKPQIDASQPRSSGMKHLKVNYKRDEVIGCRYDEIERDNRHLLSKMSKVVKENGQGSVNNGSRSMPSLSTGSGADAGARFPGGPARRNEIARIEKENGLMLKRLQGATAEYRTDVWEADHDNSRNYVRRICQYPVPDMKLKRRPRPSASLMPLMSDSDVTLQGGMDPSAAPPDFYAGAPGQGLRYVLQEHRFIGGISLYVEMATDGQTLAVSAYDRDLEDTLELLVNEENHRQLLSESGGDYGQIVHRLRINDGRLVIIPLEVLMESYEVDGDDGYPPQQEDPSGQ